MLPVDLPAASTGAAGQSGVPGQSSRSDTATFKAVLGRFASGVTVVTTAHGSTPAGFTCQSFFSLSLDPPLVAFSAGRSSTSYPHIRAARRFCVNVLAADQRELATRFAQRSADRWRGVAWSPSQTGSPIIDGVLAWIDCELDVEHVTGDHFLVVGRVVDLRHHADRAPLLYFQGAFASLSDPGAPACRSGREE